MSPLTVDARTIATAAEWSASLGTHLAGNLDRVGPSWIAEPDTWIASPDTWIALRPTYRAAILNEPRVSRELTDSFFGYTEIATVDLTLANGEGEFNGLRAEQGLPATVWRYDRETDVSVREFDGVIDAVDYGEEDGFPIVSVSLINQDLSALDTLIPKRLTGTDVYGASCPEPGRPTRVIIGTVLKLPLWHVVDDVPTPWFIYEVGEGRIQVLAVYRNRIGDRQPELLQPNEYSVLQDAYVGRTVVRVFRRQLMRPGGGHHTLYADVIGPSTPLDTRNPAYAAAAILGDATWGCGLPVDMAAVGVQAALMPAPIRLDGVIGHEGRQRPAREVLREVLMTRGGRPSFSPEFGWSITFDSVAPTTARMILHDGPTDGPRTLLSIGRRRQPPLNERVSTLTLRYGYGYGGKEDDFLYTTSPRTVGARGTTKTELCSLLRSHTAADYVAYYLMHRIRGAEDMVEGAIVHEDGRIIQAGDIVQQAPLSYLGFSVAEDRLVVGASKAIGAQEIRHCAWDAAMYVNVAGSLPPDQVLDANAVPPPVEDFLIALSTIIPGTDRGIVASVTFQFTIPSWVRYIDFVRVEYRRSGTTAWGNGQLVTGTPGEVLTVVFDGLNCGVAHDFSAVALNGTIESTRAEILAHGTASDAVPAAPSTPSISASGTEMGTDGTVTSWVVLAFTVPANQTLLGTRVDWKQNGEADTHYGGGQIVDGEGALTVKVPSLPTGFPVDYRVRSFNAAGNSAAAPLLNQVTPGDGTAPDTPGTPTVSGQKLTAATFHWTASTARDVRGYNWDLRTASGGGGTVSLSGFMEGTTLTVNGSSVGYATRHFRVQAVDFTGNTSGFTASVSVTFVRAVTDDHTDSSITGGKIDNNTVGSGNMVDRSIGRLQRSVTSSVSGGYSLPITAPGTSGTFTHNWGQIPLVQVDTGNLAVDGAAVNINSSTMNYWLLNRDTTNTQGGTATAIFR